MTWRQALTLQVLISTQRLNLSCSWHQCTGRRGPTFWRALVESTAALRRHTQALGQFSLATGTLRWIKSESFIAVARAWRGVPATGVAGMFQCCHGDLRLVRGNARPLEHLRSATM